MQEAGQADTSSMDEEREAQEEVERLDSGLLLHDHHAGALLPSLYKMGAYCSTVPFHVALL